MKTYFTIKHKHSFTVHYVVILTFLWSVFLTSCTIENDEIKTSIDRYLKENKELPLVKNLYFLCEMEQLFNNGGHEPIFFRDRTLEIIIDSTQNTKTAIYKPEYHYEFEGQLTSSRYLNPLPEYGNLKDYHIHFVFDLQDNLKQIYAEIIPFDQAPVLIASSKMKLLFSNYANEVNINTKKEMIAAQKAKEEAAKQTAKEVERITPVIKVNCKYYLKNNYLNDPDSYQSVEWSEVKILNQEKYYYAVRHKFKAKNAFGGVITENKLFYLDEEGNVINMTDF